MHLWLEDLDLAWYTWQIAESLTREVLRLIPDECMENILLGEIVSTSLISMSWAELGFGRHRSLKNPICTTIPFPEHIGMPNLAFKTCRAVLESAYEITSPVLFFQIASKRILLLSHLCTTTQLNWWLLNEGHIKDLVFGVFNTSLKRLFEADWPHHLVELPFHQMTCEMTMFIRATSP